MLDHHYSTCILLHWFKLVVLKHLLLTICRTRSSQRRQSDTDWPSYPCLCYNLDLSKMENITFTISALVKCIVYNVIALIYKIS